jgi:KDO2-lipid IV(A) lauroyltransferase
MPAEQPRLSVRARAVDTAYRVLSLLPLRALHAIGTAVGTLGNWVPNSERHVARVNIQLCFPELALDERQALVRASLRESAKGLLEIATLWYRPVTEVQALIRHVDGADAFHEALAEDRGLLIIAPHLGCWEALQLWVAQHGPSHALYRPPRQGDLEALINQGRSRSGMQFWPARPSGIRQLLAALKRGEIVGILPDQEPPEEGVFVPFFGIPARTMTLFGKFAARSGAAVILGWAERLPRGGGFKLHFRRVEGAVGDPDEETAATAVNHAIEAAVREAPTQYQWSYRRFARGPGGLRHRYKRWRKCGRWVEPTSQ